MITSVRRHVHRLVVTSVVISPHTPAGTRIHLGSSRESGSMTVCRCRVCRIRSARLVFKDHNPALAVQGRGQKATGTGTPCRAAAGRETEPHLRHVSSPRERVLAASVHVSLTFPYIRYHNHHLPSRLLEAQVRSYLIPGLGSHDLALSLLVSICIVHKSKASHAPWVRHLA